MTLVFRGYDRKALDREYNNREKVPDLRALEPSASVAPLAVADARLLVADLLP